jgi:hypothetical protein
MRTTKETRTVEPPLNWHTQTPPPPPPPQAHAYRAPHTPHGDTTTSYTPRSTAHHGLTADYKPALPRHCTHTPAHHTRRKKKHRRRYTPACTVQRTYLPRASELRSGPQALTPTGRRSPSSVPSRRHCPHPSRSRTLGPAAGLQTSTQCPPPWGTRSCLGSRLTHPHAIPCSHTAHTHGACTKHATHPQGGHTTCDPSSFRATACHYHLLTSSVRHRMDVDVRVA